ncbi:ankyrin domain-containing protein, partial [Kockovaella imperatae]
SSLPPEAIELASRIFNYARTGSPLLAQYLSAGIPPNMTNSAGDTLLMLAAYHGQIESVRCVLTHGADINLVNGRGQTPLAGAVFKDYHGVVTILVEAGADSKAGRPNAMETAGMFGRRECARIMGLDWDECVRSVPEGI